MLGASIANMLRQTLGGSGSGGASFAQGMGGGRGRFMQGNMFSSDPSGLAGGASALAGLFGGGRTGGTGATAAQARMQETAEPPFVCVHASCGRRRYRTPYLTTEFAKVLEASLARLPFVTAVRANALAGSLRRSVHEFSGWIQRNTGGALDLSSVVAGIFVLRGIRQLVLSNNTPSGSQMLWWALTLMRGWKV